MIGDFDDYDLDVKIQSLVRRGNAREGSEYSDPRDVKAKIELGVLADGSQESSVPHGRMFLATQQVPGPEDLITLPPPFRLHPKVDRINPIMENGEVHHVEVTFS